MRVHQENVRCVRRRVFDMSVEGDIIRRDREGGVIECNWEALHTPAEFEQDVVKLSREGGRGYACSMHGRVRGGNVEQE
jgi:hypothetical protein